MEPETEKHVDVTSRNVTLWQTFPHFSGLKTKQVLILSFFLSIFTGSLIYEHYTRECEFGNFDKIKNKKHKKKTKKHKNFWLNFCLNKECPKLLCGLAICHRRRQTIPMWNSTGEKRILQGITVCLVSAVLSTM